MSSDSSEDERDEQTYNPRDDLAVSILRKAEKQRLARQFEQRISNATEFQKRKQQQQKQQESGETIIDPSLITWAIFETQKEAFDCIDKNLRAWIKLQSQSSKKQAMVGQGSKIVVEQGRIVSSTSLPTATSSYGLSSTTSSSQLTSSSTRLIPSNTSKSFTSIRFIPSITSTLHSLNPLSNKLLSTSTTSSLLVDKSSQSFQSFPPCLKVFSYESQPEGRRKFLVATIDMFWIHYIKWQTSMRHFYEVIREDTPVLLYFDLEYSTSNGLNNTINGNELVGLFLYKVAQELFNKHAISGLLYKHIIHLDSSTTIKFSRHLILHLPNGEMFRDVLHAKTFVFNLVNRLQDECKSNIDNDIQKLWLDKEEITTTETTSSSSSSTSIKKTFFADLGVYTRNRVFRMYLSSKFGKQAIFIPHKSNQYNSERKRLVSESEAAVAATAATSLETTMDVQSRDYWIAGATSSSPSTTSSITDAICTSTTSTSSSSSSFPPPLSLSLSTEGGITDATSSSIFSTTSTLSLNEERKIWEASLITRANPPIQPMWFEQELLQALSDTTSNNKNNISSSISLGMSTETQTSGFKRERTTGIDNNACDNHLITSSLASTGIDTTTTRDNHLITSSLASNHIEPTTTRDTLSTPSLTSVCSTTRANLTTSSHDQLLSNSLDTILNKPAVNESTLSQSYSYSPSLSTSLSTLSSPFITTIRNNNDIQEKEDYHYHPRLKFKLLREILPVSNTNSSSTSKSNISNSEVVSESQSFTKRIRLTPSINDIVIEGGQTPCPFPLLVDFVLHLASGPLDIQLSSVNLSQKTVSIATLRTWNAIARDIQVYLPQQNISHLTTPTTSSLSSSSSSSSSSTSSSSTTVRVITKLTLYITGSRFCNLIGRHHKSNGVYWIINLEDGGTIRQGCFDNECTKKNSCITPIPLSLIPNQLPLGASLL